MMKGAILDRHIATSPCVGVKLPRSSDHEREENRYLTMDEYHALWSAMDEHFQPLLDTLAGTGIRWGEAEALQVKSLDLAAGTLRVVRAAKYNGAAGTREFGPTKTKKSRRTITLPPQLVDTLDPIIDGRGGEELVFTMARGGQLRHASFHQRYWWTPATTAVPPPRPRIHDLRHSHASWLIAAGVPLPVIQARLGHESITTTIDTYGHLLPEMQAAEIQAAAAVFANRPTAIEG
jgi:integrase